MDIRSILCALLLSLSLSSYGQWGTYVPPVSESSELKIDTNFFSHFPGEKISVQGLKLTYEHEDVKIPGNNGLDLVVHRRFDASVFAHKTPLIGFGGKWQVDVPAITVRKISDTGLVSFGCLGSSYITNFYMGGGGSLKTLGYANSSLIPANTIRSFDDGSILICDSSNNPIIKTKNGINYQFSLVHTNIYPSNANHHDKLYSIKTISDNYGNVITYNYSIISSSPAISSISRNDGAVINFFYQINSSGAAISRIEYGQRAIGYSHVGNSSLSTFQITDEIGRKTTYLYEGGFLSAAGYHIKSIELPTGAKITYEHFKGENSHDYDGERIAQKTISLPGYANKVYQYSKGLTAGGSRTLITERELSYKNNVDRLKEYEYRQLSGLASQYNSGEISISGRILTMRIKIGAGELYKLDQDWGWEVPGAIGCSQGIDLYFSKKNCGRAVLKKTTHTYYYVDGQDLYHTDYLAYDIYGNVLKTRSYNSFSSVLSYACGQHCGTVPDVNVKYTQQTYLNDVANWRLGLPQVNSVSSNGTLWSEVDKKVYYPVSHAYKFLLQYDYLYGLPTKFYESYHSNGNVMKVSFPGTSNYEIYQSYFRGVPTEIRVPDRYGAGYKTKQYSISYYGEMLQEIEFNGNVTSYTFDNLERVKKIDYADPYWQDVEIVYDDILNTVSEIKGNYLRKKWLDPLSKTIRVMEQDISNVLDTTTYTEYRYDSDNLLTFISLPSNTFGSAVGIEYVYDGGGKIIEENFSSAGSYKRWKYYKGHKVEYVDPKSNITTIHYNSHSDRDYVLPLKAQLPGGLETNVSYNIFNNITSISQGGIIERRIYDSNQQLCKVHRPESGVTAYGYNTARELSWIARGTTGSTTACGGEDQIHKVVYEYDNRGDFKRKITSAGAVIMEQTLDDDSNVVKLAKGNSIVDYSYNLRGMLTREKIVIDGIQMSVDWGINSLGNKASIIYHNGLYLNLYPDARGNPTAVGGYAGNIKFHSSGLVKSFTYGNGLEYISSINPAGQIDTIINRQGAATRVGLTYSYDASMNVKSIVDLINPTYSIQNLTYDGLDQLRTGTGKWGALNINYDNKNNIIQMTLGSSVTNYVYNTSNRLVSINGASVKSYSYDTKGNVTGNGVRSFVYDAENVMTSSGADTMSYDGNYRRVKKLKNGSLPEYYMYSKDGLLLSKITNGLTTNYIYAEKMLIARSN